MIKRTLAEKITDQLTKFPVVAIIGPRQSGKTTLAKSLNVNFSYYNLEDLATKVLVSQDPVGFINSIKKPVIIDEIQKFPDLLSQIQVEVDKTNQAGQFIITGSESLLLSEKVSQSLAGRVVNNTLLPLSYSELRDDGRNIEDLSEQIITGFYPRIYSSKQTYDDFYPEYVSTYLEKDVRQIQNVGDLTVFGKFMQLLAGRVGQLVNLTSLSNDLGVSHPTIERWISLLEASFIIYRLPPYYANLGKRLVKSPKIYFYDTGLLCHLLGINSPKELEIHFQFGSIFENLVITEVSKKILNHKLRSKIYFYRQASGLELDLMIEHGQKMVGVEIKTSQTYHSTFSNSLSEVEMHLKRDLKQYVVYRGDLTQRISNHQLTNFYKLSEILNELD